MHIGLGILVKFGASQMRCAESRAKSYQIICIYSLSYSCLWKAHSHGYTQHLNHDPMQSAKLRKMTTSIRIKVLVKFGASQMKCVEARAKNLPNVYSLPQLHVPLKGSFSRVHTTPRPQSQSTKLRKMTTSIITKVQVKFGASCTDEVCRIKSQKATKCVLFAAATLKARPILTGTQHTTPVDKTQEDNY